MNAQIAWAQRECRHLSNQLQHANIMPFSIQRSFISTLSIFQGAAGLRGSARSGLHCSGLTSSTEFSF